MLIVVIGGTGLIGSKLVRQLSEHGHRAVAAAPSTGVDTVTGDGLADALTGADVVVDVSNSPSFDDDAALEFFEKSTGNLLAAEARAGVGHHVALSVVNTDQLAEQSGYFRAKALQERLVRQSPVPYTIVHATQFYEFVKGIADAATDGDIVRLAPVLIQPMAAADVAEAMAITAVGKPQNRIVEVAGPQQYRLDDLIRTALIAHGDPRTVVADAAARYWGAELGERSLVPDGDALLFDTRFEGWILETLTTS
ncbi:SDR family oxidoreductase [Mycolicibacterium sp. D5.8-2]|uniref:SDR family oxidoreductase n=1 Tax=Mycolicibacterium sp. D5.8-2 TaxID=3085903 RepID=UPI00298CF6CF|nr:NAD(P)H-binding protein [Mycolicibacterium sp. D5.8-2]MDW5612612.1 NAD(P)H-binding protein [Mycolicibacterium sp. D5.8-2]